MFSLQECVTLDTSHANRMKKVMAIELVSLSRFLQHAWNVRIGVGSFVHVFPAWLKQVVSQLPFSRLSLVFVSCFLSSLVECKFCMPTNNGLVLLEATKAYQIEQQRLRTERRQAQLRQDQRQLERSEVLNLFALIWLALIILLYARLYLGPQE